jgi:hypothetical protein
MYSTNYFQLLSEDRFYNPQVYYRPQAFVNDPPLSPIQNLTPLQNRPQAPIPSTQSRYQNHNPDQMQMLRLYQTLISDRSQPSVRSNRKPSLDSLYSITIPAQVTPLSNEEEIPECSMCFEELTPERVPLAHGKDKLHAACRKCWKLWLERKNDCPLCRHKIDASSIEKTLKEKINLAVACALTVSITLIFSVMIGVSLSIPIITMGCVLTAVAINSTAQSEILFLGSLFYLSKTFLPLTPRSVVKMLVYSSLSKVCLQFVLRVFKKEVSDEVFNRIYFFSALPLKLFIIRKLDSSVHAVYSLASSSRFIVRTLDKLLNEYNY